MDQVFIEEQNHLTETYDRVESLVLELEAMQTAANEKIATSFKSMADGVTLSTDSEGSFDSLVERTAIARQIEAEERSVEARQDRLERVRALLAKPYFARVDLQLPGRKQRAVYIGASDLVDEKHRHVIVDWRSPVAEAYYGGGSGHIAYEADGRTIEADLTLRRQFDIEGSVLHKYYDSTSGVTDPLLLEALSQDKTGKMVAITATIQKEQNKAIRHDDAYALLIHGIAGSGKTSVLMQRIAYLLYRQRATLDPSDIYLVTPNSVFQDYVSEVLPGMGERNPHTITWDELMSRIGASEEDQDRAAEAEALELIDKLAPSFPLEPDDFRDIRTREGQPILNSESTWNLYDQYGKHAPMGHLRSEYIIEDLKEDLDGLELSEHFKDEHYTELCESIERGDWLDFDRIGKRMLRKNSLTSIQTAYLRLTYIGGMNQTAKYVVIDEVQNYSTAQLMVLAKHFPFAKFILLGDEYQTIEKGAASFDQVKRIFVRSFGKVEECKLLTSYRSSPEITELFTSLLPERVRGQIESVQRPGTTPQILMCDDLPEYSKSLEQTIGRLGAEGGSTAVIASSSAEARHIASVIPDVMLVESGSTLPEHGTVVLDVSLAKGLEFDRVIIPNANAELFPDDPIARNRLYTAISRATKDVTILSMGSVSPLLASYSSNG